jgi:hypothetical protein
MSREHITALRLRRVGRVEHCGMTSLDSSILAYRTLMYHHLTRLPPPQFKLLEPRRGSFVTYPFHPLVGQSVSVIGSREHGGMRHLVIRKPDDGSKYLLPEWMTFSQAGAMRIVPCPRLSIHRLIELRDLIDRLMLSSPGTFVHGERNNETNTTEPTRPIQDTVAERPVRISTSESTGAAKGIAQRSDVRHRSRQQTPRSGGRR